ncbi:hypothetical protein NUW54_g3994 [Trametes sanguinea]|uniref:Uncharacterized protein n=1 Tax=Trametes sanguinea TaxID=158606 RepID=A0ACC1PZB0_9APHY|nr:hypothetical protein NUW54_g3994 [Trametes sanguinea]
MVTKRLEEDRALVKDDSHNEQKLPSDSQQVAAMTELDVDVSPGWRESLTECRVSRAGEGEEDASQTSRW